jgi:hypothetical protein
LGSSIAEFKKARKEAEAEKPNKSGPAC